MTNDQNLGELAPGDAVSCNLGSYLCLDRPKDKDNSAKMLGSGGEVTAWIFLDHFQIWYSFAGGNGARRVDNATIHRPSR